MLRHVYFLPKLLDDEVISDDLFGELDFEQSMLMVVFCLAAGAEVEVFAQDALVPDAEDAELVLAAGTDDVVHLQDLLLLLPSRLFLLLEYLGFLDFSVDWFRLFAFRLLLNVLVNF